MNKTKFWKAAKVTLLTLFVSLFTLGMVSLNDAEEVTAETAETVTGMTVEDVYDLTSGSKTVWKGRSGEGNFQGYQSSVDKNYEFTAHMELTFAYNTEFAVGIMANATGGISNTNDGYWFVLNEVAKNVDETTDVSGRTAKLWTTKKKYVAGVLQPATVVLTNANGELNDVWTKLLDSNGVDFSFGAQEKIDEQGVSYTYVYVKIDGQTLIEYDNYDTSATYGKYVFADSANRANIYANKRETPTTVETIYDITDGAPIFDGINGGANGFSDTGIGTASVGMNFEFNTNVLFQPKATNHNELPIGILCSEKSGGGYGSWSDGYWFVLNKTDSTAVLSCGRPGNTAFHKRTATLETDHVVFSEEGFHLAFGVEEIKRGETVLFQYIYVKVNGEMLFDYYNTDLTRNLSTAIIGDTANRATFTVPSANDVGVDMLGASIKIANTGIRFATEIDTATYNGLIEKYGADNVTLGTVVLPTVLLQGSELTLETAQIQNSVNEVWFDEDENTKEWTCVVRNVPDGAYNIKISARSYLQITTNGKIYTFYAQTIERSIADVAQAALKDYVLTTDAKYDADIYKYEYVVDGVTYYHAYDQTDRTNLQKYVEGV